MRAPYRRSLKIAAVIFAISALFFLVSFIYTFFFLINDPVHVNLPEPPISSSTVLLVTTISFFTSVASAIAFVSTFVLSWTKERRERTLFTMETEKKKLETEKLELELEEMRKRRNTEP